MPRSRPAAARSTDCARRSTISADSASRARPCGSPAARSSRWPGSRAAAAFPSRRFGQQVGTHRHRHLSRSGRCRRTLVGSKINQRGVGFMANGRDHRNAHAATARTTSSSLNAHRSSSDPPPRATISRSGRGSGPSVGIESKRARRAPPDPPHPAPRPAFPTATPAPRTCRSTMQDIADHRAGRVGDHTDHRRHRRDRLFLAGIEQPFGGQSPAAFLAVSARALAGHFHGRDDDLIFRAPAIDGQLAGDDDLKAFLGLHTQRPCHRLPADTVERALSSG